VLQGSARRVVEELWKGLVGRLEAELLPPLPGAASPAAAAAAEGRGAQSLAASAR